MGNPFDPEAPDETLVEAALGSLTDRERAVFVLKGIEGLETGEVARTLGVTATSVRRHQGLARSRLRRVLARYGGRYGVKPRGD